MARSDNPSGAVNQQERLDARQWVVGFTDGEGCFSIAVVRNPTCRLGWQVQHEFSVTQGVGSRSSLELVRDVLGCGRLVENSRHDDHRQDLLRFSVKRRRHLIDRVVPFFEENPLRTAKRADFEKFSSVLRMTERGEHLDRVGLRDIALMTEQMNRRQRSRYLGSSEAIRRPSRD